MNRLSFTLVEEKPNITAPYLLWVGGNFVFQKLLPPRVDSIGRNVLNCLKLGEREAKMLGRQCFFQPARSYGLLAVKIRSRPIGETVALVVQGSS